MDLIGQTLFANLIQSEDWRRAGLCGLLDSARIAETVRIEMGLDRDDISGAPASEYLSNVLGALQKHAETQACKSYGRYRWMWYLRRLPDEVFDLELATTGPYDRLLTEVLATRGADPKHVVGSPEPDGTFRIDRTVVKRIAWLIGFATFFSQIQVECRIVGKSGIMGFDRSIPGLDFPVCQTRKDETLNQQIREYDKRNERPTVFTQLGVPYEPENPSTVPKEPFFSLIDKVSGPPRILTDVHEAAPWNVVMRYRPAMLPFREIVSLLSDPVIKDEVTWSEEIPILVSLLSYASRILIRSVLSLVNVLQTGYLIVDRNDLDNSHLIQEAGDSDPGLKGLFPESPSRALLSNRLLQIEGVPWPLLAGPVAFFVNEELIGLDLYHASQRLMSRLTFPNVGGEAVNLRSDAFEKKVQEAIDETGWAPPERVKRLRGHHFKRDGKWIGEVDAFGTLQRTLLLVSCKSIIYTAEYEQGLYRVVRNVRTTIENSVRVFAELELFFAQFPSNIPEYDFSGYDRIVSIVVTPQVMYVHEPLLSQEVLPGLRKYLSFEEFRDWLRQFQASEIGSKPPANEGDLGSSN